MRERDKPIFLEAAQTLGVFILVRDTNEKSLPFIGRGGFLPKPKECMAKTADAPGLPCAGLVVDPTCRPEAFTAPQLAKAKQEWLSFAKVMQQHRAWKVEKKRGNPYDGCVTLDGSYVHGDYDLKDVIPIEHFERNLASVEQTQTGLLAYGPKVRSVQQFVNERLGTPMIQHGAEAQYADLGSEGVWLFAPDGATTAHFATRGELGAWYKMNGRRMLDLRKAGPAGDPNWKPRVIKGGQK